MAAASCSVGVRHAVEVHDSPQKVAPRGRQTRKPSEHKNTSKTLTTTTAQMRNGWCTPHSQQDGWVGGHKNREMVEEEVCRPKAPSNGQIKIPFLLLFLLPPLMIIEIFKIIQIMNYFVQVIDVIMIIPVCQKNAKEVFV